MPSFYSSRLDYWVETWKLIVLVDTLSVCSSTEETTTLLPGLEYYYFIQFTTGSKKQCQLHTPVELVKLKIVLLLYQVCTPLLQGICTRQQTTTPYQQNNDQTNRRSILPMLQRCLRVPHHTAHNCLCNNSHIGEYLDLTRQSLPSPVSLFRIQKQCDSLLPFSSRSKLPLLVLVERCNSIFIQPVTFVIQL